MTTAIEFTYVSLGYHQARPILTDVNLAVAAGEFVGIIGPNGSGKSTLLRSLFGLGIAIQGEVSLFGRPHDKADLARMGYVPQRPEVDPMFPVSVLDVVLMGRTKRVGLWRRFTSQDRETARQALGFVNMTDFAARPFGHLSGGQQQRVMIARALAQEADLLVFDEALNALDLESQQEVISLTQQLHSQGKTILFVLHNFNELARHFTGVILVNKGTAHLGAPAEILTPETLRTVFYIDPQSMEGCLGRA
jgi:ABC-type Mn2+/Zn2+ transport system ATPase subunit